jgi:hypothetical protein
MRWTFAAATVAITGMSLLTLDASPTEAAVFSNGNPANGLINTTCMDVSGNDPNPGAEVLSADCHAGPNQQFQWAGNLIFAESGQTCLALTGNSGLPLVPPVSVHTAVCDPTDVKQQFFYRSGRIQSTTSIGCTPGPSGCPPQQDFPLCLDAPGIINAANQTPLRAAPCNNTLIMTESWQIK